MTAADGRGGGDARPREGENRPAPTTIDRLVLPEAVAQQLRGEAMEAYPREACGLLAGTHEADARGSRVSRVVRATPAANAAARGDRFLIDARQVWETMRASRADDLVLVGAYHSHPDARARPSQVDIDDAWGEWLHVIVSCDADGGTDVCCWRIAGGVAQPVPICDAAAEPQFRRQSSPMEPSAALPSDGAPPATSVASGGAGRSR